MGKPVSNRQTLSENNTELILQSIFCLVDIGQVSYFEIYIVVVLNY